MTAAAANAMAFLLYAFIQGITPGPANTVSVAAGMAHGRKRALVQWAGLVAGFLAVSAASYGALWALGETVQDVLPVISVLGAAYVLCLAFRMLRPVHGADGAQVAQPTFKTGFIVQATNAKIIVACLAAFSSYVLPFSPDAAFALLAVLVMPAVGTACNLLWLAGGALMNGFYEAHRGTLDKAMAAALALCAASMVMI